VSGVTELGEGVRSFQAPLWQTNSLIAVSGRDALLCDPAFTPAEIEAIGAELARHGAERSFLLVTHADYDHVCGIPYFPAVEVAAGPDTAARIREGTAATGLRSGGDEWGVEWPSELRVDRELAPADELELGAFKIAVIDTPSHGREGVGFVLPDQGILLPGDNLSAITIPLLAGSLARACEATARLLGTLDRYALRHVVPGHGPVLSPEQARRIGEEDLRYLEALVAAAREAASESMSRGYALVHVYGVEPPRANTIDFDIYDIRGGNARLALKEYGAQPEA
jgi:glyoxylase-like metal-dependent hydrolase (beta-lactamase superfamily II)